MKTSNRKYPLRRSPVPKKRPGPARIGRVVDQDFIEWMHETQPCLVFAVTREGVWDSRCSGRRTFHHVRENGSPKHDRRGLMLCEGHHLHDFGPESIERLGKKAFEKRHGVDIEKAIVAYNNRYAEETGR